MSNAISLMYHDVIDGRDDSASGFPGPGAAVYKLSREEFVKHLECIRARLGVKSVALTGPRAGSGHVFLTFDDGGASSLLIADLLEEHGWRGHFFITTGRIDTPGFLGQSQIRALHERGHLIGSHSHTHPTRMAACDPQLLRHEWSTSVRVLSDLIGQQVTVASVPGGFFSRAVAETAAASSIRTLFTSEPTASVQFVDGCCVLGRYTIQRGMPPQVSGQIAAGCLAPRVRQAAIWSVKKAAKRAGGAGYLKLRELVLSHSQSR